jgi:Tfp pilus assembly protein PilE
MQASTRGRAQPPSRALVLAIAVLAAVLALAGCQSLRSMSPQARRDAATAARLLQLQQQNMRFADNYVMRLIEAVRAVELRTGDPMQRYHLSGWMLAQAITAYSAASGDNAVMGALDLVATVD